MSPGGERAEEYIFESSFKSSSTLGCEWSAGAVQSGPGSNSGSLSTHTGCKGLAAGAGRRAAGRRELEATTRTTEPGPKAQQPQAHRDWQARARRDPSLRLLA